MNRIFQTEPEASAELEQAALWYDRQRPGLGVEFLNAIDATLDRISRWPQAGRRVPGVSSDVPARRAPVSGFPYHVAYLEMPDPFGFSHSCTIGGNLAIGILE